jgi:hypothetical protein
MQSAGDSSLVCRKGSEFEETQLCVLLPRCNKQHFPVNCLLFWRLPVNHRVSLLLAAGICKKCLSHSKGDGSKAKQCEEQHGEDHWLCRSFSVPEGPGIEKRMLPVVTSQPGRLAYKCWTVIHVNSRLDLQSDRHSVQLTTLYDSNQRQSYIVNEVALAQALRYVQVPNRIVYTSPTTLAKTNKLFILDVKPRSTAVEAGAQLLAAYGVEKVELTLPEEPRLNMLRSKFETRPGYLSNAGVAQPKAVAHLVIGRNNPVHIPEVITRSIRGGPDLYFMRNDLFPGEMLFGETEKSGSERKKVACGPKTTSTPKTKNPPAASKKSEKAAQVRTQLVAKQRPNKVAEEQPIASSSGIKDRRRQDSSPTISLAALDSLVSSLGRTTSTTPVRDGGEKKKSISRERALIYARKSRVEETSSVDMARDSSASRTRAVSPGEIARGNCTSKTRAASPGGIARGNSTSRARAVSPRSVSRGSSTNSSHAVCLGEEARGSSFKGSLTRDFRLQVFFINQCPPGL